MAEKLKTLRFAKREITLIESNLNKLKKRVEYINGDFSRLLGSNKIYDNRDFESQLIRKRIRKMGLKKIGRRLCERFSNPELKVNIPKQDIIEKTAKKMIPSTQEIISVTIEELPKINIHHLDPIHRGFKPGALNFAYRKDLTFPKQPRF